MRNPTIEFTSPYGCPFVSRFASKSFQSMSTFDPNAVRKAVEEFTPRRPQKFEDLIPAKGVIAELRQKRASYRAVAELLTQHCLPTSKTAIAMFCHQVLGEKVRPRRRLNRKPPVALVMLNGGGLDSTPRPNGDLPAEVPLDPARAETMPDRARGPRIAQIRKLHPQNDEKTDSYS
jgi:hypothetical protein